jgi:predicted dehydrogenase
MGFSKRREMCKMEETINVGVLGAGYWGRKVISEYLQLEKTNPKVHLTKVCDLSDDNLSFCKEKLHVKTEKLSSEYTDLLCSDDINAVHICTPNDTHHNFCLSALNEDKHVLLEKPMALNTKDAWELCDVAERKHLCLQVGHIYRFNNAMKMVRKLILENYFGNLYYLKMQWTTLMPSPLDRDIIFDLGPHPVDIMNYLLQQWPLKVSCSARAYRRKSLEEVAHISMDFSDNIMAHVELSWLQPGKVRELCIMGEKRSAIVNCLDQKIIIYEDNNGGNYTLDVIKNNTIFDELSHFANSINDKNNDKNPGAVGANNVTVLENLKKSATEERTITMGSRFEWRKLPNIQC